ETPVIVPGASSAVEKRPDRVVISGDNAIVIDYKFGSANPAYRRQVQEYCDLYRRMGYGVVKGYVWYVREDRVEEV
ncbi:MAG: CRISPR-associated protein Cas4, partial [Bacteroidales bacterium]|nr:CRISPR-associated protein Cas4 [Bacteroidales bacterium]